MCERVLWWESPDSAPKVRNKYPNWSTSVLDVDKDEYMKYELHLDFRYLAKNTEQTWDSVPEVRN